jgi:hypothetical protein
MRSTSLITPVLAGLLSLGFVELAAAPATGVASNAGEDASAGPSPVDRTSDAFPFTGPDYENSLVIFVNSSRETFCTPEQVEFEQAVRDWLDAGMQGPFPDEPLPHPQGLGSFPIQLVDTPMGVIVNTRGPAQGLHMELWVLDDASDQVGVGACLDTDDADELFGTGTGSFRGFVTDAFGLLFSAQLARPWFIDHTQGSGEVTSPDGERYSYSWMFHQHIPCDGAPGPVCETSTFQLRPLD